MSLGVGNEGTTKQLKSVLLVGSEVRETHIFLFKNNILLGKCCIRVQQVCNNKYQPWAHYLGILGI